MGGGRELCIVLYMFPPCHNQSYMCLIRSMRCGIDAVLILCILADREVVAVVQYGSRGGCPSFGCARYSSLR